MPDGFVALLGVIAMLLGAGATIGVIDRRRFDARWLAIAAVLVLLNDLLLTRCYGAMLRLLPPGSGGNWQGKAMAMAASLAIAALPAWGWWRSGLTLTQRPGSLRWALPVAVLYSALFVYFALLEPDDPASWKEIAFQLTMPGFEEEVFYRGILLLALDRAFTGRIRLLGVDWGWGALLSCLLFGLAHAFGYDNGGFDFALPVMILTAGPSLIAVWLRYRTGSILLPIVMHNFGNSISLFL